MGVESELPAPAYRYALLIDGRVYYYAELFWKDAADEVYVRNGRGPLCVDENVLDADLADAGIDWGDGPEISQIVDVDRALAVVDLSLAGEDIDVAWTVWNGFEDLMPALGLPFGFRGRIANRCYDKLFYGLNLECITPPGEHYVPVWRPREITKMKQVMRTGAERLRVAVADLKAGAAPRETLWRDHRIADTDGFISKPWP